jgi:4-diphosphocytidyl-2-C-methyl-D-erythritol kinase
MSTRVRSYSKINLGLAIGPVRGDGFHGLTTLYQTLALHDVVTVTARRVVAGESKIVLTTNHAMVPTDERNTAWKIVERSITRMGVSAEVVIHIEKQLPVQGGMGAGSANAAAALIGLERELGIVLPNPERLAIAAEVGSDVPLFLIGGAVLGVGRGEIVSPMRDLPAMACVIAVPEIGVSTPLAFRDWDEKQGAAGRGSVSSETSGLTSGLRPDRLEKLSHVYASVLGEPLQGDPQTEQTPDTSGIVGGRSLETQQGGLEDGSSEQGARNGLAGNPLLALVRTGIENDFESVVFHQYPLLREIKRLLMGEAAGVSTDTTGDTSGGAIVAALSGSGSALFGLYRSQRDARAAQRRVQASGCKALLTETLPRQEYWRRMFAE